MKCTFNKFYLTLFFLLFIVELIIGLYIKDNWIRAYFGDFLVVILLYCLLKGVVNIKTNVALIAVLLFSYLIEILQYFDFVSLIGLQHIAVARVVIGTSFSWIDLLMYTLGIGFIYGLELIGNNIQLIKKEKLR